MSADATPLARNDAPRFVDRSACPACSGRNVAQFYACAFTAPPVRDYLARYYGPTRASEIKEGTYSLMKCRDCELVYQRYIGDSRFLERLYDVWLNAPEGLDAARLNNEKLLRAPEHTRDAHELMWASSELRSPLNELRTLDYGMGLGLWAQVAQRLGCESYGFDLSPARMAAAAAAGVNTLSEPDFPPGYFDFINTEQVLEHVPAPGTLTATLAACLRPGGILKVCVPYGEDVEKRVSKGRWDAERGASGGLDPVAPLEHINCFKSKTLEKLARGLGLSFVPIRIFPQYAYLARRGAWSVAAPLNMAKELCRPLHRRLARKSLYVWLRRPL